MTTGPARPPLPVVATGAWTFRTVRPGSPDVDLVHRWMNDPDVALFWDQAWSRAAWIEELGRQLDDSRGPRADDAVTPARPCIAERDGRPVAYLELYWGSRHPIARHYAARPDDVGVHIAVGEPAARGAGWGSALLRDTAHGMFAAVGGCTRILAEPSAANRSARRAFVRAGFREVGEIDLPHKRAMLVACTTVPAEPVRLTGPGDQPPAGTGCDVR